MDNENILEDAQSQIDGTEIARMQKEFVREFRDIYPTELILRMFIAVGPMHSFIGFCMKRGYLDGGDGETWDLVERQQVLIGKMWFKVKAVSVYLVLLTAYAIWATYT